MPITPSFAFPSTTAPTTALNTTPLGRPTPEDDQICLAWAYAYETYLWSYLVKGPSGSAAFSQQDPVPESAIRAMGAIDPTAATAAPPLLNDSATIGEAVALEPWEESLDIPLKKLREIFKGTNGASNLAKFARLCAWQAVSNIKGAARIPKTCQALIDALRVEAREPNILASITDINATLRIPKDSFPTYTLQMTVTKSFDELAEPLLLPSPEAERRQSWLLCPGPVCLEQTAGATSFRYLFPLRSRGEWQSREWQADYLVDMSQTESTLRLDFSLEDDADKSHRLLQQDRGYFLMRKKAGYVGATEVIVERSLWFANAAFTMNATLMPLFRMIVESRVLRELSKIIQPGSPSTRPPASTEGPTHS